MNQQDRNRLELFGRSAAGGAMKYWRLLIFILLFTMVTACGNSSSSFHPKEWAGTYAGAHGTVMTLAGNGTARISHASSDENIDTDSSWDLSDDMISVHCKAYGYDISASTRLQSDGVLLFKSADPAWDPEPFLRISEASTALSKDDYLAMIEDVDFSIEGVPSHESTGWDASSYTTAVVGGIEFHVPDYYQLQRSTDSSMSYAFKDKDGVTVLFSISITGDALSDDDFMKEKYRFQNDFMKELGVNGHRIMDARNCRIAGFQSRLFTFYADTAQDGENHVRTACINNTESGKCVSVCLLQHMDSLYDYVEDFNTIIETAAAR